MFGEQRHAERRIPATGAPVDLDPLVRLAGPSPLGGGGQTDSLLALGNEQAGGGAAPGQRWTVWGQLDLQALEGEQSPAARYDGEECGSCRTYVKAIDLREVGLAVPVVDELASIDLDLWAVEQGLSKLHTNLLGM